ncbi:MAG: DUF2769 domain-containing protein [Methanomethylovorans sp.]|uniref:DUF2769 domain-containing protein n=1 Tax=Methanomethylovorans sp. TaxID=2758717 RepID=UPI0035315B6F
MMFCARKNQHKPSLKADCLCLGCHTHEKFKLEGDYFCFRLREGEDESNNNHPDDTNARRVLLASVSN